MVRPKGELNTPMNAQPNRRITTAVLVVGAVAFGMVLAGGLKMTPDGVSSPSTPLSASQIAGASGSTHALPSFADLAEAVDPAVVSIQASTISKASDAPRGGGGGPRGASDALLMVEAARAVAGAARAAWIRSNSSSARA